MQKLKVRTSKEKSLHICQAHLSGHSTDGWSGGPIFYGNDCLKTSTSNTFVTRNGSALGQETVLC